MLFNLLLMVISTNHINIGLFYIISGLIGGSIGFGLSVILRLELALPGYLINSSSQYNSIISFHGLVMISFMIMPLLIGGFGNLLIPLMLCSSDMIFPRLNAISFWLVMESLLLIICSIIVNGGINCGWTFYIPSSLMNYSSIDLLFFSLHSFIYGHSRQTQVGNDKAISPGK